MGRVALLRDDLAHWVGSVSQAEFWAFDYRCFKAISETGGSYTLDDNLSIGGTHAVTFGAPVAFTGTVSLGSHITGVSPKFTGTLEAGSVLASNNIVGNTVTATTSATLGDTTFTGDIVVPNHANYLPCVPVAMSGFAADTNVGSSKWNQSAESNYMRWQVVVPHFHGTITAVTMYVMGPDAQSGIPENMPRVHLYKQQKSTGTITLIGTEIDGPMTLADYKTAHPVTLSGLSEALNSAYEYTLRISGESGANYVVGTQIWGVRVQTSTTDAY